MIRGGGVVLYPSDTIYGLGCDPFRAEAVERIFRIKGRPEEKGVLVLIPDESYLKSFCRKIPRDAAKLMRRFWPGPVTFLFPARSDLPELLKGRGDKIGLRLPLSRFLREWMGQIPGPLVSTSANLSGHPPPEDPAEIKQLFHDQVDLILEAGRLAGKPSSVVDLTVDPPRLVRAGENAAELARTIGPPQ